MGTADRVVQHVLEHARCPQCGASYRVEDIHVLGQLGDRVWDLAAVCPECYELSLARAVVEAPESPLALTDGATVEPSAMDERTEVERLRLARLGPIAPTDVADAAAFLEGFDGDLDAWLAPGSRA